MTCYSCALFPKAEIRALFALIVFEIPGLTGISGSALPCGHHLKLPVEKSQLRVSSWRKQFSCITSSMSSACGSSSQERQKQQMRYRSGKEDPSLSVGAALQCKLGAGRGELATAFKQRSRAQNHPVLLNHSAALGIWGCEKQLSALAPWYWVTILTSVVQQDELCLLMHQFFPSPPKYNSLFSADKTLEKAVQFIFW